MIPQLPSQPTEDKVSHLKKFQRKQNTREELIQHLTSYDYSEKDIEKILQLKLSKGRWVLVMVIGK